MPDYEPPRDFGEQIIEVSDLGRRIAERQPEPTSGPSNWSREDAWSYGCAIGFTIGVIAFYVLSWAIGHVVIR